MTNQDLEECVLLLAKGDESSLRFIYDGLGKAIYSLSYSILKDHQLAEDNSQEVFMKLFVGAKSYSKGTNVKAWIMRIVRNTAIDSIRKSKGVIYTDFVYDEIGEESSSLEDKSINLESQICGKLAIKDALSKLDNISSEIVVLHLDGGLKFKDISKLVGLPLFTVTGKYQTALKKLKKMLD